MTTKASSRSPFSRNFLACSWGIAILFFCFFSGRALLTPGTIQFDILSLLPEHHSLSTRAAHQFMKDANLSRQVILMIGHEDPTRAERAFHDLQEKIVSLSLPLQEVKPNEIAQSYRTLFQALSPYRQGFLSPQDRSDLSKDCVDTSYFVDRALSHVSSPFAVISPNQFQEDPFFTFSTYVQSTTPSLDFEADSKGNVILQDQGKTWYLYKADLQDNAFSLKVQDELCAILLPLLQEIEQNHQVRLVKTGTLFYAAHGAQQAQSDISMISTLSLLGIIILLLGIFRTARPLLLAGTVIATGILGGLTACLGIFGSIHILALVFGCSLVGVTVDYAIHYFCAQYSLTSGDPSQTAMRKLTPAILFSLSSSVAGYALLFSVPFPGIQQMAILASVGLLVAFLTVYCWGPILVKPRPIVPISALFIQNSLEKFALYGRSKLLRRLITAAIIIGATFTKVTYDDHIQNFQSLNPELRQEEEMIRKLLPFDQSGKFILITGDSMEGILQTQEKLSPILDALQQKQIFKSYRCLAQLLPSKFRQYENQLLLHKQLYGEPLKTLLQVLNLPDEMPAEKLKAISLSSLVVLLPEGNLPGGWKELVHHDSSEPQGRIILNQVANEQEGEIRRTCASVSSSNSSITYIDVVQEYNQIFATYRHIILMLMGGILVSIFMVLCLYKNIRAAFNIIQPVFLSLLATVALLTVFSIPITLFHVMGLLLVLCIGIDYGFFLFWRKPSSDDLSQQESQPDLLLLGNALAAVTTILSFGLLSVSETTAVRSFGMTVFIGIALNFILTTLYLGARKSSDEEHSHHDSSHHNKILVSFFVLIFIFTLAGCSTVTPSSQISGSENQPLFDKNIYQNKEFFPALKETKTYLQQVKTTVNEEEHIFSVHITLSPQQIDFIAFHDLLGQLYHLKWTPDEISWEASSSLPTFIQLDNIMEDFLLIHLPLATLKNHLKDHRITEEESPKLTTRQISSQESVVPVRQIQRSGPLGFLWEKATLTHPRWGYQLDITTVVLS